MKTKFNEMMVEVGQDEVDMDDMDDIAVTSDTIDEFISAKGRPNLKIDTAHGIMYVFERVQARKGCARGDLWVADLDGNRYAYFTGEA